MILFKQTGEKFSDIESARDAVIRFAKSVPEKEKARAELLLDAEEYVLFKSAVFSAKEEPALARIALSVSCEEGRASFTSARALEKDKFQKDGDVYIYSFEKDENGKYPVFRDLYLGTKRISPAKSEVFLRAVDVMDAEAEEKCGLYIPESAAALLPDGELGAARLTLYAEWEFLVLPLVSVERDDVKYSQNREKHVLVKIEPSLFEFYSKRLNAYLKSRSPDFFLANHPSLLEKNTWCYDHKTGVLYYCADALPDENIAYPALEKLFVLDGMNDAVLENLEFHGITDKLTCENGYFSGQANVEKRTESKVAEAAIFARDVCGLEINGCVFDDIGTNGVLVTGEAARVYVRNCRFENIAMSAVSIGNPVTVYCEKRNCSFDVRVEDNFLKYIGYDFPSSPAIDIFRADGLSICRNTIEYCAYSGVSVGWSWAYFDYALGEMINIRDAEIAYNRISHHMQILRDGGAIYVVGANCTKKNLNFFNTMHDNFAYRDSVKRTVRGLYLDGSSSNWHVYNNVASGAQRPMFTQFVAEGEFTHNILVQNIYVTEGVEPENHAPERNNIYKNIYFAPTIDELLQKYPKAREIYENSGCGEK